MDLKKPKKEWESPHLRSKWAVEFLTLFTHIKINSKPIAFSIKALISWVCLLRIDLVHGENWEVFHGDVWIVTCEEGVQIYCPIYCVPLHDPLIKTWHMASFIYLDFSFRLQGCFAIFFLIFRGHCDHFLSFKDILVIL